MHGFRLREGAGGRVPAGVALPDARVVPSATLEPTISAVSTLQRRFPLTIFRVINRRFPRFLPGAIAPAARGFDGGRFFAFATKEPTALIADFLESAKLVHMSIVVYGIMVVKS